MILDVPSPLLSVLLPVTVVKESEVVVVEAVVVVAIVIMKVVVFDASSPLLSV